MKLNNVISVLKESKKTVILPHISVDGDCLGSALALCMILEKAGKKVSIYIEEDIPYIYKFLPGIEMINNYNKDEKIDKSATVIAVDTGDIGRLGKRAKIFKNARITVNIDHHGTNTNYAVHNLVKADYAAAGEIIYEIAKVFETDIKNDISVCLYVAISTDTGGFRYGNTTPKTHLIASELLNNGIDVAGISRRVFETISAVKAKLISVAINSLEYFENGRVAYIYISNKVLKKSGALEEDCDGIVNIGRNIRGVEVSVMLREWNGGIKCNLRSNTYVDVSEIATVFSGGGHAKAAGFTIKGNVDDIKNRLFEEIGKRL
jgi:bifunctional oligoribonuclease and PAP phosphatase NrnA